MQPTIQDLKRSNWEGYFRPATLRRAQELVTQNAVRQVAWNDAAEEISGEVDVDGSVWVPEIQFRRSGKRWKYGDAVCDCDELTECEHAAAVIYSFLQSLDSSPSEKTSTMPPDLIRWLQTIQSAAPKGPNQPTVEIALKPAAQERILYILEARISPLTTKVGFSVKAVRCRRRKNGTNGRAYDYYLDYIRQGSTASYIQPEDVDIARRLYIATGGDMAYQYQSPRSTRPQGNFDSATMEALIATGRCHWQNSDGQPLSLGNPRPAKPSWTLSSNGRVNTSFETEPPSALLLIAQPPWYLDLETLSCGPLITSLTPNFARVWIEAPALDPIDAARHTEFLTKVFEGSSLPPPPKSEILYSPTPVPVPVLHLASERVPWWESPWTFKKSGGEPTPVLAATVSFAYGNQILLWGDPTREIRTTENNVVSISPRNFDFETSALAKLGSLGLTRGSDVFPTSSNAKLRSGWTLSKTSDRAMLAFTEKTIPKLRAEGWQIERHPDFALEICQPSEWYFETGLEDPEEPNDWFGVELGVRVGEEKINLLPVLLDGLQRGLESLRPESLKKLGDDENVLVQLPDGRRIPFPATRLREILDTLIELHSPNALNEDGRLVAHRLRAAQLSELASEPNWIWNGADNLRNLADRLRKLESLPDVTTPASLKTGLRSYQLDGLRWLQFVREFGLGGILADDMGLGKTVQAIAHILVEKEAGRLDRPVLVVSPTSVLFNWAAELERFAPDVKVLTLHGSERHARFAEIQTAEVVLTTYPLLPRDADELLKADFHAVLLDEAQNIKNPRTQAAQVVCQLKARHRICLSGTPIENHLGELWSLFTFLIPGFLGDETRFRTVFRNPIERANDDSRRKLLSRRVRPFLLRRRKEEVETELPTKTEIVRQVELADSQRDLYETIRLAMEKRVRDEVQKKGVSRSHIVILDALLKLRQVCCDPRLVKLESARRVTESAKLDLLMELLPTLIEDGRRILLFSQFTSMLALIEERLKAAQIPWLLLTGDTDDRATPVRRFQAKEVPLFLISLKAGGSGLNLTAADTVILYDPWWNPAVEAQATDRAHRIGQDKPVFVYRLLTTGTAEEKMAALQARKRELVQSLLEEGSGGPTQLQEEDIRLLFSPIG